MLIFDVRINQASNKILKWRKWSKKLPKKKENKQYLDWNGEEKRDGMNFLDLLWFLIFSRLMEIIELIKAKIGWVLTIEEWEGEEQSIRMTKKYQELRKRSPSPKDIESWGRGSAWLLDGWGNGAPPGWPRARGRGNRVLSSGRPRVPLGCPIGCLGLEKDRVGWNSGPHEHFWLFDCDMQLHICMILNFKWALPHRFIHPEN